MSIQSLENAQTYTQNRRSVSGHSAPAGSSFQDRLAQTAAKTADPKAETLPASGQAGLTKDELLSRLLRLRLDQMKLGKEKKEEEDAWNKLMAYLDAWIESLQEGKGDIEKISRAYASLQAGISDAESGRKGLDDCLLEQLENMVI